MVFLEEAGSTHVLEGLKLRARGDLEPLPYHGQPALWVCTIPSPVAHLGADMSHTCDPCA